MKSIFSRKKLFVCKNPQGARFLFFGIIACFFFLQLPLHAFAIDGYTPDQIQQANGGAPAGSGISEFVHNIAQYYGWENTPEESEANYTANKAAQGAANYAQQAQTQAAAGNVAGAQAAAAKATADSNIAHNAANNAQAAQALNSCSFAGGNLLDCTISILAQVAYFLMTAAGFLLGLVGIIFNWVVVITVFQFGTYFGNTTGMLAAWAILRDIGNIALLFSFISIGVMMILDVHGVDAKKALPRLIIFAILLNFSLFISEAVVDVADVVAASIYTVAGTAGGTASNCNFSSSSNGASTSGNANSTNCANYGIAGLVVQDTGASGSFNPSQLSGKPSQLLLTYIGTTIFILVVMVVLLAAAIMFVVRAVMLCILLIVSPLGFAGMAIPQFEERAKQWQKMLIDNAVFAPIFLLLVLIGLKVMEAVRTSVGATGSTTLATALSSPGVSLGGILISFALVIGFMVAALIYARGSSAAGAQFATNFAQRTVRGFVSIPARPLQIGTRNTIGGASQGAGNLYNSTVARMSRNPIGKVGVWALRNTGIDEGVNSLTQQGQNVKIGLKRSYKEEQDFKKKRTADINKVAGVQKTRSDLNNLIKNNQNGVNNDAIDRLAQKLKLDDFKEIFKQEKASIDELANVISAKQFGDIMNDGDVSKDIKDRLKGQRFGKYNAWVANRDKDSLRGLKNDELSLIYSLDPGLFQDIAVDGQTADGDSLLSEDQKKALISNQAIGPNISKRIGQNNRKQRFSNAVDAYNAVGVTPAQQALIMADINNYGTNLTKDEISSLKKMVLLDPNSAVAFDATKLAGIMAKNDLNPIEGDTVLNNIHSYYMNGGRSLADPKYQAMKTYLNGNPRAKAWFGGNGLP